MAEIYSNDIGKNIRGRRNQKGLSLAELGAMTGVSGQAIYQYESGKRSLKFEMIEKIATALETPVDTLLGDHNFVSGKSNKIKALPLKWATVLNLKELLLPNGKQDEGMEEILGDHDVQVFLYGFFLRIKEMDSNDRGLFLLYLSELIERKVSVDEVQDVGLILSGLYSLNEDGFSQALRQIGDLNSVPHYKKSYTETKMEE